MSAVQRVYAAFFLYALALGGLYPRMAEVQQSMGVGEGALGLGLIGTATGTLISLTFGGRWIERWGAQKILWLGLPLVTVFYALAALAPHPFWMFMCLLPAGICIGAIEFGNKKQRDNKYLIIESEKFRFKQFISDLSGQDIRDHKDTDEGAIKIIRNWLANKTTEKIPSASIIISDYKKFLADLPDLCEENMWTIEELTFDEYSTLVTSWLTFE